MEKYKIKFKLFTKDPDNNLKLNEYVTILRLVNLEGRETRFLYFTDLSLDNQTKYKRIKLLLNNLLNKIYHNRSLYSV